MFGGGSPRQVSLTQRRGGLPTLTLASPDSNGGGGLVRRALNWLPANKAAHVAVLRNDAVALETALCRGADANASPGGTPLLALAVRRFADEAQDVARVLLAHDADPNARDALGHTPLSYCFDVVGVPWHGRDFDAGRAWGALRPPEKGWTSSVEAMALEINEHVPPHQDGRVLSYFRVAPRVLDVLVDAGTQAHVEVVYRDRNMTERWPDAATTAQVAAFVVSMGGWGSDHRPEEQAEADAAWQRVMALVAQGVGLERPDHTESTLLLRAVQANRPDVVRALLDSGANPDHRNRWGQTATSANNEASAAVRAWQMEQVLACALPEATGPRRARL